MLFFQPQANPALDHTVLNFSARLQEVFGVRVVTLVALTASMSVAMLTFRGGNASAMRVFRFVLMLVVTASWLRVQAQQAALATEPAKTQSGNAETKPAADGPAVDAAKVTGATFESEYFKFTYQLPKGWKALDDAARVASNEALIRAERDGAAEMTTSLPKKASPGSTTLKKGPGPASNLTPPPARYSLMAASSNGLESLASPVLPRINIWAHQRVGALDNPADHAQFLVANKRTQVLVPITEVTLDGHKFVRVDVVTPTGEYQSEFVSVVRDYLVGFDFRAQSERELVDMAETMKSVKFQ